MGFQKDDGLEVTGELDDELFCRLLALRQEMVYSTEDGKKRIDEPSKQSILGARREAMPPMITG
jgi:hypothetical protein